MCIYNKLYVLCNTIVFVPQLFNTTTIRVSVRQMHFVLYFPLSSSFFFPVPHPNLMKYVFVRGIKDKENIFLDPR